jgi:glutamine synthetase
MVVAERRPGPAAVLNDASADEAAALAAEFIERHQLTDIEVMWVDHQGHARGKRIDAASFVERARSTGFAFCNAALSWDITGEVKAGLRHSDWDSGFPDFYAVPDLTSLRLVPWRERAGHVISDLVDHDGNLVVASPRTVLRRAIARIAQLGYRAEVGVEIEFHLLREDGTPIVDGFQSYSLQVLNELDPVFGEILDGLREFVALEGGNSEYGPGQCEVNLRHAEALAAADQAARFKYATRELARRRGALATFMAKPFAEHAGNSMHLHVSLWRDDGPAFAPTEYGENPLMRHAIGGVLRHLPGIVLFGAPTVNSYKRYEVGSFAPATVSWGGDNRTVAVRSLVESADSTRIELRTGAADAQPHWAIASALAAIAAGIEAADDPGQPGQGDLYRTGRPLPRTLAEAAVSARADDAIGEILGANAVHDVLALAELEWAAFTGSVTEWDRQRYLRSV